MCSLDGLDVTTEWLSRHITSTTPLTTMDEKRSVISQAYIELLTWNDENEFPEVIYYSCKINETEIKSYVFKDVLTQSNRHFMYGLL